MMRAWGIWADVFCVLVVSGGFAVVQPNSTLSVNAVEAYALEDFSPENVRAQLAEAQKVANGAGSEQDVAEAKIEIEVREHQTGPLLIMKRWNVG